MAADLFRVILPVETMDEADAFWSRILDLEIDAVVPGRHYLHTGGAILALVDPSEHGGSNQPMSDWTYIRVPDVEASYAVARQLGCPFPVAGEADGISKQVWGDVSFYTHDPFGNPICFIDDVRSETPPELLRYTGKPIANVFKAILPTRSLGRSGAFFEELLGLEVDTLVPNRHFVHCDSCVLALVNPIGHARDHGLEAAEFTPNPEILYFAVPDLDATFERAQKLGLAPIEDSHVGEGISVRPWGERSFYGLDPSGNPICFVDDQTVFRGSRGSRARD